MPKAAVNLLVLALLLAGCHKQPQRVMVAPPPAPAVQSAPPAELPPPPQVDTPAPPAANLPQPTAQVPPAPPAPAPAKANRRTRVKKETQPPAVEAVETPTPAAPSAPPPDLPQLGEILSPQDTRRLNADLDRAMRNAKASLQSVKGKVLNAQQETAAEQAASFLRQAAEMRLHDLPSACSLAQRAEVIARDLARTVK